MAKKSIKGARGDIFFEIKPKLIKCRECGKEFETKINSKFARKYCEECSKKNKEYYENLDSVSIEDCED